MPLTDTAIRVAKSEGKARKMFDGGGLFLLVTEAGGKHWKLKYRHAGKEKLLSFGSHPQVSLRAARERREEAKRQLAQGINPSLARHLAQGSTVEVVANEWLAQQEHVWVPSHTVTVRQRLRQFIFPALGSRPVAEVKPPELLAMLRAIESRGTHETAHRVKQVCSQVFRFAVATGRAERDPTADLRGALAPVKRGHFATITEPRAVGALLRAIDTYDGDLITRCALRFAPLVFVRPGELRKAQWDEFDLAAAEWRIPAQRMKMKRQHIVPLSTQALGVLTEAKAISSASLYVFPSGRSSSRPMSDGTISAALRRMGYEAGVMTGHGFRSMASTLLNEMGTWSADAIERQLAHSPSDDVRAAYNYAQFLSERRRMMQAWADYLDSLRAG